MLISFILDPSAFSVLHAKERSGMKSSGLIQEAIFHLLIQIEYIIVLLETFHLNVHSFNFIHASETSNLPKLKGQS